MKSKRPPFLNRYTTLPIALDILSKSRVTILSPSTWVDRNDAYYLERYQEKRKLSCLLALCFSSRGDTFHHWRVFADGPSGVCIEFDKDKLLRSFSGKDGFRSKKVSYRLIPRLEANPPELESWPFLKRDPYKDEDEFRIVFESTTENSLHKEVEIDLSSVKRITLSPWLPKPVAKTVAAIIKGIDGCHALKVNRSTLIENSRWMKVVAPSVA